MSDEPEIIDIPEDQETPKGFDGRKIEVSAEGAPDDFEEKK